MAYLCLSVLGLHVKRSHSLTRAKFHSDLYISEEFLLITSSAQATELIRNSYPSLTDVTYSSHSGEELAIIRHSLKLCLSRRTDV